mgnify:CR=1 FL=1
MTGRRLAAGFLAALVTAGGFAGCAASPAQEDARYNLGENGAEIDVAPIASEWELPGYVAVADEGDLTLFVNTQTTEIAVRDGAGGTIWYSNPPAAQEDPIATPENVKQLLSQVSLTFYDKNNTSNTLMNYDATREYGRYGIRNIDGGIAVSYVLGNFTQDLLVPPALTEERYNLFYGRMDDDGKAEMRRRFRKVTLSQLDDPNERAALLSEYPSLESESLYIKYEMQDYIAQRLADYLAEAGYTAEDYEIDCALSAQAAASTRARFTVTIEYTLDTGGLTVRVPIDSIHTQSENHIHTLSVLPYFGAAGQEAEGYMLVPDGSGALVYLNNGKTAASTYSASIYSPDYSKNEADAPLYSLYAGLPFFGMRQGENGIFAVIEGGAASARVRAEISGKQNAYNTVYPQFIVQDNTLSDMGSMAGDVNMRVYQSEKISQDIQVRYRFLHGEDSTYSGMARAYREHLKGKEALPDAESASDLPMLVDLVGSMEISSNLMGVPVKQQTPLTTFAQAESILAGFLDGGVENLSVRYLGWYNRGLTNVNPASPSPISELGGKKGLNSLLQFAEERDVNLYLGADLLYLGKDTMGDGLNIGEDTVQFMDRSTGILRGRNPITMKNDSDETYFILSPRVLPDLFHTLSGSLSKMDRVQGLSLLYMNQDVNSDFNRDQPLDRSGTVAVYREVYAQAKAAGYRLLMDGANDYGLPWADGVTGLPYQSSEYQLVDESIPFVQMVFSGSVTYYSTPINLGSDFERDILRMVETGSGLYARLAETFDNAISANGGDSLFSVRCSVWKDRLLEAYAAVNEVLGPVQGVPILKHRILTDGVRMTVYENGRSIAVNYTDTPVQLQELDASLPSAELPAGAFLAF